MPIEERRPTLERGTPRRKVGVVVRSITVFERVVELVERRTLGVEKLSVPPNEVVVDSAECGSVPVGHDTSEVILAGTGAPSGLERSGHRSRGSEGAKTGRTGTPRDARYAFASATEYRPK